MFEGVSITHYSSTIGHVIGNSVRVGSDGFYADIGIVNYYGNTKFEFKDINWNGFTCNENKLVIESILRIIMRERT